MYKFIEIECPSCEHRFVWLEYTYKGKRYKVYRRTGHNEVLESTVCPKCNLEMEFIKDLHIGVDVKDSYIEDLGSVHGI